MNPDKRFFDIFKRYNPTDEKRVALEGARVITYKHDSQNKIFEIQLAFERHEDPELIYEIEAEVCEKYEYNRIKIIPRFSKECFSIEYFPEVAAEAVLSGAVTRGFFSDANYYDDGETITVKIPFDRHGIEFVEKSSTSDILARILFVRYNTVRKIAIEEADNTFEYKRNIEKHRKEVLEQVTERNASEAIKLREEARAQKEAEARAADPHYDFDKKVSMLKEAETFDMVSDTVFKIGTATYDISNAELIYGDDFDIVEPNAIANADKIKGSCIFLGTVFEVTTKDIRRGEKFNITIGISDGACGIYLKKVFEPDKIDWSKKIKEGMHVAVSGRIMYDKFDNEAFVSFKGIKKIKRLQREDNAKEKRVELHLHTNMSQMDAIISPKEVISTAIRWGHKAIAVTDHGNVQSYPEIMLALEKAEGSDLKVLYGMEAYYVNDTAKCVFGNKYPSFEDEMTVFDIETTGFDNRSCKIIEIGAVKIKSGKIIDTMDIFVDPECPIPEEITKLTSITDEMVKGQYTERQALEKFLDFAKDTLLIAHNANFDCGFIRVACQRQGFEFNNTYLDTLGLSKFVNSDLKQHNLAAIAKHYELDDFHHHRASDDATILAHIFFKMQSLLISDGITNFDEMIEAMSEKTDPLKLDAYHMVIFAKNLAGLKNLYKLISMSYLKYYGGRRKKSPRIPKSVLENHREGLIIGSACESGELYQAILKGRSEADIEEIADFYDYLEIQPLDNNRFLIDDGEVANEERLIEINKYIYDLGKKLGKPVCATCDAHFVDKEDEIYRRILLAGQKFRDADKPMPIYLRTTDEMLKEFEYLGKEAAYEVVVTNTNLIADMCDKIRPIPKGTYTPNLPGANEDLTKSCWDRAHEWYGDPLPALVENRLKRELDSIIKNGFAVLYMIAVKLVDYSEKLGYLVGSRGSVGSSFVATVSGISEVNPLPPHYRCPKCRYSEFFTDGSVGSGFDLPDKNCPKCGEPLVADGQDIPFETFLGFHGDKSPDIDLNFSGDVQGKVHKFTEDLFGEGHVFRAGTTGTIASKTAWGYVNKYLEDKKVKIPKAEISHMVTKLVGIKRTTGQHPGGIIVVPKEYEIYDFTPVQHPADDPTSDIITTHFQFSYLHDTILKLDELGHDMPTKYKVLERYTNTSVLDVKMNDKSIYELFYSTAPLKITPEDIGGVKLGTFGIPEMGTRFIQQVLEDAQPRTFADLMQISGLTHGTDVWLGNAQDLIKAGTCTISEVVGTRDGIMLYLQRHKLDDSMAFKIMEDVRKGKGLKPEYEKAMLEHGVPEWYINSCKKIKYMFPKAHAAAYVMSAIRLCWYKIYYPMEFYAAFFTVAPGGFDAEIAAGGYNKVSAVIKDLEAKGNEATQKDHELLSTLQLVREALARGVEFLNVDLKKSDATAFLPENGKIRMPFNSLTGLGDTAAEKIIEARNKYDIFSIEELRNRTGISKTVVDILRRNHVLDGLSETNQFSLF